MVLRIDKCRRGRYHVDADSLERFRQIFFIGHLNDYPDVSHDHFAVQSISGQGPKAETIKAGPIPA